MVRRHGQGKSDEPAEGNLSGVPARSAGPTGGGEAISAHGPTCRARFARPLADAGRPGRQHGAGSRGRRLSIRARTRPNSSRGTATSAIWKTA